MARLPRYDLDQIKAYARGRWPEILAAITDLPADLFDGKGHPCPKCAAGKDRFRFTNRDGDGSALCNQCYKPGAGDGISLAGWLTGKPFAEVLHLIAQHLGIDPIRSSGKGKKSAGSAGGKSSDNTSSPARDPAEHLQLLDWDEGTEIIAALWCRHKPPITIDAIKAAHGRVARYRRQYTVIALPVWGQGGLEASPVGWALYNATGGTLPSFRKDSAGNLEIEQVRIKITAGSQSGLIGPIERIIPPSPPTTAGQPPADPLRPTARTIWKLEGPSDLLGFLSLADLPPDVCPVTNPFGAGETPKPWITALAAGMTVYALGDADIPGATGAAKWAAAFATAAEEVYQPSLPHPVAENHGKDLRDWINDRASASSDDRPAGQLPAYAEILSLADGCPLIKSTALPPSTVTAAEPEDPAARLVREADDDPHRLARVNLEQYRSTGRNLVYWAGEWYAYKRGCYRRIDPSELTAKLNWSTKKEIDRCFAARAAIGDVPQSGTVRKVGPALISAVLQATAGMTSLSSAVEPPMWIPDRSRRNYLSCNNGIVDLDRAVANEDDCLIPHTPDWFSTVSVPYDFDPKADGTARRWEAFLERNLELDPERIKILQEWFGYCLTPNTDQQKFLILEGEGANGKSVCCAALAAMLGRENVKGVGLELFGDKFELYSTIGKLANICGDAAELDRIAEGRIKEYTAGTPMEFQRKYLSSVNAIPTAKLIIACNNRPRWGDRSNAVYRRMIVMPWRVEIPEDERIPGMDKPWWWEQSGELPAILIWSIKGLARLRAQGRFTSSTICNTALEDYRAEMNPAKSFLREFIEEAENGTVRSQHLYEFYSRWCKSTGHHPLGEKQFGKEVFREYPRAVRKKAGDRKSRYYNYLGISYATEEINGMSTSDTTQLF